MRRPALSQRMPERSLDDWLKHLERIHPAEIDLGLARVSAVAREMGLATPTYRVLTVAGTNGKGSVVYASEAILRAHGLRTGRYTSPHLLRFNERIAVDGVPARDAQIVSAFEAIERARGEVTLTYFEFATLAALWVFREVQVDVAVLEVGLGGRLDAVNIVDCDLAVVTSIALDHQNWLGETLDAIAPEKAAVARSGRPVVLAEASYPESLDRTLAAIGAPSLRAGESWSWHGDSDAVVVRANSFPTLRAPVPPGLRAANVAAALRASMHLLNDDFREAPTLEALHALRVPARRQRLRWDDREWVLDVAHNPAAMKALATFLQMLPPARTTVAAFGAMRDKDLDAMTQALAAGVDGALALAIPGIERAGAPEAIWEALDKAGIAIAQNGFDANSVLQTLSERTEAGDRLVVCGSFHSVAGIMELLPAEARGQPC